MQASDEGGPNGVRIPAREIEAAVVERLTQILDDPINLAGIAGLQLDADALRKLPASAERLSSKVRKKEFPLIRSLIARVTARSSEVGITLNTKAVAEQLGLQVTPQAPDAIEVTSAVRLTRTGMAVRLIQSNGKTATREADPNLVRLILQARHWWSKLADGDTDIATLARSEGVNDSWMSRVVRLNFLAPEIVEAILDGNHKASLNAGT